MDNFDVSQNIIEKKGCDCSQYTRQIIYGGLDGIITTFSIVAASVGANLDFRIVITMGIANLFADAISMGFGEYISTNMETRLIKTEREKKLEIIHTNIFDEKEKMIRLLVDKNMERNNACDIVHAYTAKSEYSDLFLDYFIFLEHNMLQPDKELQLIKNGVVTFFSFILFGSIPLLVFITMCSVYSNSYTLSFLVSTAFSVITMFLLGFTQGFIIADQNPLYNGFIVMLNGIIATSCAYGIGYLFEMLLLN